MSPNRIFFFFILVLALTACRASNKINLDPTPLAQNSYQSQLEEYFQNGKTLLEKGDLEEAKSYFDKTIDIILDSDLNNRPYERELLNDYVEKISEIELNVFKDKYEKDNGEKKAFLDEVIATPLFLPSEQDIQEMQDKLTGKNAITYSIPVPINSQVVAFIKAFQNIRHEGIQNALNRSTIYIEKFKEIFRKNELPEDLAYLPIIESGYRIEALSRARARGMWQFMASTARLFGLTVDWVVDERLDPFKSADAAARYLKKLYEEYGDWHIVLACYNGGTRRIQRAINRLQSKEFFEINHSRYIRRETRNYVPAFLASLIIAKSPNDYGFTIEAGADPFANCKMVSIPSPASLQQVADLLGISLDDLKKMNPELQRDFTPPNSEYYSIRIPSDLDETALKDIRRIPPPKIIEERIYRVRPGDTLYSIARKFRVSLHQLKKVNGLRSNLIRPGRRLLIPGKIL